MIKPLIALAALLSTSAIADTLVTNVNGMQVGADGQLQHFSGLLIGKDGKVKSVLTGPPPPMTFDQTIDGHGQTLLPGLIDGHGHVMDLGFAASASTSPRPGRSASFSSGCAIMRRLIPTRPGSPDSAGTRSCGRRSVSRLRRP